MWYLIAVHFLIVHSPDGREIDINPAGITSLRERREGDYATERVFSKNVKCWVGTSDGKFVTTIETCAEIRRRLEEIDNGRIK
jgi:hypothetical protein